MGSCGNDKKKAFLTKPRARIRNRLQEAERAEQNRLNRLHLKTRFQARILAAANNESAGMIVTEGDRLVEKIVRVRVFELDSALQDPGAGEIKGKDKQGKTLKLIKSHEIAFAPEDMALQLGDLVIVEFEDPPISDRSSFSTPVITVVGYTGSDEIYKERIMHNLGGDEYENLLEFDNADTVDSDALYTPRKKTHLDYGELHNGRFDNWDFNSSGALLDTLTNSGDPIAWTPAADTSVGTKLKDGSTDKKTLTAGTSVNTITFNLSEIGSIPQVGSFIAWATGGPNALSEQFKAFAIDHYKKWGTGLLIVSFGRSFKKQVALYDLYIQGNGNKAATPGSSNHGWLMAIDLYPVKNQTFQNTPKSMSYHEKDTHSKWIINEINNQTDLDNQEGKGVNEPWHMSIKKESRKFIWE